MFRFILFFILAFRIGLFLLPSFQIDMNDWKAWSIRITELGPSNFYSPNYFSDYFPGYLYLLWLFGLLFKFLNLSTNSFQFEILIKSVTTIFDIGTAFLIYKIVSKHNQRWSLPASIFYLLNPAVIFNSSIWGQIDGIFTFFLVLSTYFLFEKKQLFKSSIGFAFSTFIKPQSLAFAPIFIINSFKKFSFSKFFLGLIISLTAIFLLSFPFFPNNPILGLIDLGGRSQNVYPYTSLFAFNFWGIFDPWRSDNQVFIMSLKMWGIALYIFSLVLIFLPLIKKKTNAQQFYFTTALSLFAFFLLLTRIHERYFFPILAFLLIAAIIKKSKLLLISYSLISFIHLINLWFVYYYYNFVYTSLFEKNSFLLKLYPSFVFINNNFKIFSSLMVLLFILLMLYLIKPYVKKT